MELTYFGHAAVGLRSPTGEGLLVDPYRPGGFGGAMGYEPIDESFDWGVASHDHDDHAAFDGLAEPPELVEEGRAGPFQIERFGVDHDEYGGGRFGGAVDMLRIACDGVTLVHGADVGQSPDGPIPDRLRRPDVALVPVGGLYTAGPAQAWEWVERLGPRLVIPTHYATDRCDLPLGSVAPFLARAQRVVSIAGGRVELTAGLPSFDLRSVIDIESVG